MLFMFLQKIMSSFFFLIIINYLDQSYQYINELKEFTNSVIPLTKQSHLNSYYDKFIKHPCYLKDFIFITNELKIMGTGNYHECYKIIQNFIISKKISIRQLILQWKDSKLYLSEAFNDIFLALMIKKRIPYLEFKKKAFEYCEMNYKKFTSLFTNITHGICLQFTYGVAIVDQYLKEHKITEENNVILVFYSSLNLNKTLSYFLLCLCISLFLLIENKKWLISFFRKRVYKAEQLDNIYQNMVISNTILSFPVVNHLFTCKKCKDYLIEKSKINQLDYYQLFHCVQYLIKSDIDLYKLMKETLLIKQNMICSIFVNLIVIVLVVVTNICLMTFWCQFCDDNNFSLFFLLLSSSFISSLIIINEIITMFIAQQDLKYYSSFKMNLYVNEKIFEKELSQNVIF